MNRNEMEITPIALLAALAKGSTLENRGTGWWLEEKRVDYRATKTELVSDELVEELERSGMIRVEIPYKCARAILTDNTAITGLVPLDGAVEKPRTSINEGV